MDTPAQTYERTAGWMEARPGTQFLVDAPEFVVGDVHRLRLRLRAEAARAQGAIVLLADISTTEDARALRYRYNLTAAGNGAQLCALTRALAEAMAAHAGG